LFWGEPKREGAAGLPEGGGLARRTSSFGGPPEDAADRRGPGEAREAAREASSKVVRGPDEPLLLLVGNFLISSNAFADRVGGGRDVWDSSAG